MKCAMPSCTDGVQNGTEVGVDCGGACPLACVGGTCTDNGTCASGMCYGGACVASVNGCTIATADDRTADTAVTIDFGGVLGNAYAPRCIRVAVGTTLTFQGNFGFHPHVGGQVSGGVKMPQGSGPFFPDTSTGTTANFVMSSAGTFPYYCNPHATGGMTGAVFVTE
jgi:plastocyanin